MTFTTPQNTIHEYQAIALHSVIDSVIERGCVRTVLSENLHLDDVIQLPISIVPPPLLQPPKRGVTFWESSTMTCPLLSCL